MLESRLYPSVRELTAEERAQILNIAHAERNAAIRKTFAGLFAPLAQLYARVKSHIAERQAEQRAIDELRGMDDRELADMGLSRCEIEYAVRHNGPDAAVAINENQPKLVPVPASVAARTAA